MVRSAPSLKGSLRSAKPCRSSTPVSSTPVTWFCQLSGQNHKMLRFVIVSDLQNIVVLPRKLTEPSRKAQGREAEDVADIWAMDQLSASSKTLRALVGSWAMCFS